VSVLALDTGSYTGYAICNDRKIISGIQNFSKKAGQENGAAFIFFRSWLVSTIKVYKPKVIIYEQGHHRGAGTVLLLGFITIIQEVATEYDIKLIRIHSATLKKYATGNGRSTKDEMMAAARKKKWKFEDDNESDALWLLDHYLKEQDVI
jgi:Holliday junction resolvasome RuvABC endonuclease subunit